MPRFSTSPDREGFPPAPSEGRLTSRWLALPAGLAAVLAALVCFATAAVALWSFYENARRLLKENLRDGLRSGAAVLAASVDPEAHRSLTRPEQENSPEYIQAIRRLETVRLALSEGARYRFVYTCVRKPEGLYFVLDPTPGGDADHDGVEDKSHIGDFYPEANPRLRRVFDTGTADVDEEPVTDSWGSALSGYAPIRDAAGNVIAVAGVDLELTEFNSRIGELRRVALGGAAGAAVLACLAGALVRNYQQRLRLSLGGMTSALEQSQAGERAKSEFLATVSHELRTPLNGILGMVDLLERTPLNSRQREQAGVIHRSGELLRLIIDDMLDWSKIESGALEIARAPVHLPTCLREVRDWFLPLAARKGLTLEVTPEEGCPDWFEGDPAHLRQVLMHLTGNAVKFTHEGGVMVRVRHEAGTRRREGVLIFTIRDTGIGIRPDQQEKIFHPFSQGDSTTTRHYGGTGLGLAISRRLCQAMGGEITLRSEPRQGSEFTFRIRCLPLNPPPGSEKAPVLPGPPAARAMTPAPFPAAPAQNPAPVPVPAPAPRGLPAGGTASPAAGEDARPVLLISPDRMLTQLSCAVFKRLQRPLVQRPGLSAAREFLASAPCRAVLVDTAQVRGWSAAGPALLREAAAGTGAGPSFRLIAILTDHDAVRPPGFDAVICRRLKMDDLEAALGAAPPPPGAADSADKGGTAG